MGFFKVVSVGVILRFSIEDVCGLIGESFIAIVCALLVGNGLYIRPGAADPSLAIESIGQL
jgi:hypothetical protein